MAIRYLKYGKLQSERDQDNAKVRASVEATLADIVTRGDEALREMGTKFDNYTPDSFRQSQDEVDTLIGQMSQREIDDIRFSHEQVVKSARAQCNSMPDIGVESLPGVILSHPDVTVQSVGSYIPGGKFPMVASAHMSVATAKVAEVPRIIACTPPFQGKRNPAVIAAIYFGGADEIDFLGGIQAVGTMAIGMDKIAPVHMLVGPGNAYVAEAKWRLYGRVGIDLFAGPTETRIIADDTGDVEICATDLLGQAGHGYNSPALLLTNSPTLAEATLAEIDRLLQILPTAATAATAAASWRDYSEVILCDSYGEMLAVANDIASEHVQVIATSYTLPTKKADRYTGGLGVGKFLNTYSYQRIIKDEAPTMIGAYDFRLWMLEGFVGNAEQCNLRVRRYGGRNVAFRTGEE